MDDDSSPENQLKELMEAFRGMRTIGTHGNEVTEFISEVRLDLGGRLEAKMA